MFQISKTHTMACMLCTNWDVETWKISKERLKNKSEVCIRWNKTFRFECGNTEDINMRLMPFRSWKNTVIHKIFDTYWLRFIMNPLYSCSVTNLMLVLGPPSRLWVQETLAGKLIILSMTFLFQRLWGNNKKKGSLNKRHRQ